MPTKTALMPALLGCCLGLAWGVPTAAADEGRTSAQMDFSVRYPDKDPLENLPPGARFISSFGERAAWSPDGTKLAFIGSSYGDAFEYDLRTGKVRNLTGHSANQGFLRVHYLPDGNLLLLGPRKRSADRQAMRIGDIELWYMGKEEGAQIFPLGEYVSEGIAVSRTTNTIAFAVLNPRHASQDYKGPETTKFRMGTVAMVDGVPKFTQVRSFHELPTSECVQEAQDFRRNDQELVTSCYDLGGKRLSQGKFVPILHSKIAGIDLKSGKEIVYWDVRDGTFAEVEGIAPSGDWTMVECGGGEKSGLDLCRLELKPNGKLTRLTRMLDYGAHRVSNPVVSPDGKMVAFQFGRASDEAGVGLGIIVAPLAGMSGEL